MSTVTMLKTEEPFTITILNREFPVKCEELQQTKLEAAANHLNQAILTIRNSGKLVDQERMLVMAALNITHDYLTLREKSTKASDQTKTLVGRLKKLREKLGTFLVETEEN